MKLFKKLKAFWTMYDASEITPERSMRAVLGDRAREGSEDTLVTQFDRDAIIRQCRDVYRNNPVARGIVKRLCDMVVGQGISPLLATNDSEWNRLALEWWNNWCKRPEPTEMLSFVDLLNLAITAVLIEGGSAFLLHRDGTVDILELERFRADPTADSPFPYRQDRDGHITHWCIHDRVDGGVFSDAKGTYSWVKAENILTMFPRDRADQIMPISQLASCMAELRDIQELNRFTLRQAKVQSLASLVHKRGTDGAKANFGGSRLNANKDDSAEQMNKFALAQGINILDTTGDVHALAPATPSSTYESFVKLNLKLIAMAVGIPLDVLMLWFSDGTYASSKATLTQAHEAILKRQQLLIRCLIEPLFKWRIRKAIAMGELPEAPIGEFGLPEIRVEWRLPAYEWMDAQDSLQSSLLSIRAGLSTLREECEKRGHNLEDLMRTKIQDAKMLQRLALDAGLTVADLSDIVIAGAPAPQGSTL